MRSEGRIFERFGQNVVHPVFQEIIPSRLHCRPLMTRRCLAGSDVWRCALQYGPTHVHQDRIKLFNGGHIDALLAIVGFFYSVTVGFQHLAYDNSVDLVIRNNQYPQRCNHTGSLNLAMQFDW
jgi:hypothetical protein